MFKFIECSREPEASTPPVNSNNGEQSKNSKIGELVPKKLVPKTEILPHDAWTYFPFPASKGVDHDHINSLDITHSPNDVSLFVCTRERHIGKFEIHFKGTAPDENRTYSLDMSLTSISVFGNSILATSKGHFGRINRSSDQVFPGWNNIHKILRWKDKIRKNDTIVAGKLVSETVGYILTKMGRLICITWALPSSLQGCSTM